MSKKPRKTKKKQNVSLEGKKPRRSEYYTAGELFLAGLGLALLILAAGIIVTSLMK